uniref:GUN4-like domain-containing protein n=1 Tax=Periphykon beckeri TaxID=2006982 RepID=A0A1Z1M2M3_9FLOR|nr:hypothetical protein [Periphykon beckeri]ARW60319.1 hypothetical protein [Periphykon beckeri]
MTIQKNKLLLTQEQIRTIFTKDHLIITNEIEQIINHLLINEENKEIIIQEIIKRTNIGNSNIKTANKLAYNKKRTNQIHDRTIEKLPNDLQNFTKFNYSIYQNLQNLLINKKFKEADKLTQKCLCDIVNIQTNTSKNWLYFTDIQLIPKVDLFILDLLWKIYSKGKFGFSIQKKIWLKNKKQWEKFWQKIGWLKGNEMKRYPKEFMWTIDAPEGHLPLFNQLRGTQTLFYLFKNIEW